MRFFEAAGYETYRMAGSHSPFDVIALGEHDIILAQVKGGTATMTPLEVEKAKGAKAPPNAKKLLICWPDRARFPITKEIE
jgi:hypothetical protein